MSIKNNKGITMIALAIVVIIMVLLASVTVYESNNLISIARVQSVTTDLLLIQAKIRIINEQVIFENDEEKKLEILKGSKLNVEGNSQILEKMIDKGLINNEEEIEKYYVLYQNDLDEMTLDNLDYEDGYVVNYETEEVIYVKGVKNSDGNYLYKLSEMNQIQKSN